MFVFENLFVAGKFFLFRYFSAAWGFPNNGMEHKVGKINLYSVLNLILKLETFFTMCMTVVVKLAVFMLFDLRIAVNCGINVILFLHLSISLC